MMPSRARRQRQTLLHPWQGSADRRPRAAGDMASDAQGPRLPPPRAGELGQSRGPLDLGAFFGVGNNGSIKVCGLRTSGATRGSKWRETVAELIRRVGYHY